MKKKLVHHSGFLAVLIILLIFSLSLLAVKIADLLKPVEVTKMPAEVTESIKNITAQKTLQVPILVYHYVEYVKDPGDTIRKSLNITPYTFEAEVKTLKENGYTFLTLADLAEAIDGRRILTKRSVVLTFDDGYRDFYTDVFPILKKYQVKAVSFVVPNFLDKHNNLTTWQLKEIAASGLVEIGAHTMDHIFLTGFPAKIAQYEVEESKKYLETKLGIKVTSFAYPYGAFDNKTIDIVKKAGFNIAVTSISGIIVQDINRFFLYRIRPGGRIGSSLLDLFQYVTAESTKSGSETEISF